jgi:catechol 2,3-dioxygenase-like lactoylglutathione lyase family enzyme
MVIGGNVTVFVSDMDRAVRFYTEILGLRLVHRFGDHWASIDAGPGLTIGLHPASAQSPAGCRGSITIGLQVASDLRAHVEQLRARGVVFEGDIGDDGAILFANFVDPDGNASYLCELKWAPAQQERAPAAV